MKHKRLLGHLMAAFCILVWGTTFVSTKVVLKHFTPIEILLLRFMFAYVLLWIVHPKKYKSEGLKEEAIFFGMGLSGVTMYFVFENISLSYTLASNVSLLITTAPIFTAILAHWFVSGVKFKVDLWWGFCIAMLGVAMVIFNGRFVLKLNPLGDVLAIGAAFTWGIYSVLLKQFAGKYNYIYLTRKIFFYGILTALPLLLVLPTKHQYSVLLQPTNLLNFLFLSILGSGICYVLWNTAVDWLGVITSSNYIYLTPLITLVAAAIVLGENITYLALIGTVLILLGVYVSEHGIKALHPSELKRVIAKGFSS